MDRKRRARPRRVERGGSGERPTGVLGHRGDLWNGERILPFNDRRAVDPFDLFDVHALDGGSSLLQLSDEVAAGVDDCHAGGERGAAAFGDIGETNRFGVGNDRCYAIDGEAEFSAASAP